MFPRNAQEIKPSSLAWYNLTIVTNPVWQLAKPSVNSFKRLHIVWKCEIFGDDASHM